jgi:hypothetical protein
MTDAGTGGRRLLGAATLVAGLGALAAGLVMVITPGVAPGDTGVVPPVATRPATTAAVRPSLRPSAGRGPVAHSPARLSIAALDVEAGVEAAGVGRDGSLSIPEDPRRLGWWIGSARPGDRDGTVLIAGHVDTAADGRGALFRLEDLAMGARIIVRAGDHDVVYRAVARRSYRKSRLPADLFRSDGAPRLVLVTCGGRFSGGAYARNVVVYAEPL